MPYTPKTYTTQVTAADLSRAETGIQAAQAGVDLAAPQAALDVVESDAARRADLPIFLVDYYRTITATDKLAAEAALAAANASTRGGTVWFGPRSYDLGDLAIVLPTGFVASKVIHIRGSGRGCTQLHFTVDRGAGTFAIRGDSAVYAECASLISDMQIIGPGVAGAVGTVPAVMRCLRADRLLAVERVMIRGFHTAYQPVADHNVVRDCTFGGNYYGVYFAAQVSFGDQNFEDTGLDGNTMASIAIAPAQSVSFKMIGGHVGFCPYGIYIESGATVGPNRCTFIGTSWEAFGNAAIHSVGKTADVIGTTFVGCSNFSQLDTYKLPSTTDDYMIYCDDLSQMLFDNCLITFTPQVAFIGASVSGLLIRNGDDWYSTSVAQGKPIVKGTAYGSEITTSTFKARIMGVFSGQSVTQGQLVGLYLFGLVASYAVNNGVLLVGVALQSATGDVPALVCYEGENVLLEVTAAVTQGTDCLVVSSTNKAKAQGETFTGAMPARQVVGGIYSGDGSGGTLQANVKI